MVQSVLHNSGAKQMGHELKKHPFFSQILKSRYDSHTVVSTSPMQCTEVPESWFVSLRNYVWHFW